MARLRPLLVLTAIAVLLPAAVFAQEGDVEAAQRLDAAGKRAYEAGDYAQAAEKFHEAHEAYPSAMLWKTEVAAWKLAGDCEAVRGALDHALSLDELPAEHRRDVQLIEIDCALTLGNEALDSENLERAREEVALADALDADGARVEEIAALEERVVTVEREVQERAVAEATAPTDPNDQDATDDSLRMTDPAAGSDSGNALRNVGWTLVGVGSAVLVTQAIFVVIYHSAEKKLDSLLDECGPNGCDWNADQREEAEGHHRRMTRAASLEVPMWLTGGLLTTAGAVLILFSPTDSGAQTVGLSPNGIQFTHRF